MNIVKNKLCFDPTSLTDNDVVGSFLLDGYGNQISSIDGSLNVNVTNPITLDSSYLNEDGYLFVDFADDVEVIVNFNPSYLNEDGYLIVDIGTPEFTVSLDSEYASGSDHTLGDIGQFVLGVDENGDYVPFSFEGNELLVKATLDASLLNEDGYINVNLASPVEVNVDNNFEREFDAAFAGGTIAQVGAVRDDVLSSGAGVSTDGDVTVFRVDAMGSLWTNHASNVGILTTLASVTDTPAALLASNLAGRRKVIIQNTCGGGVVYVGDSSVTTSNGLMIPKGASAEFEIGPDVNLYIVGTGSSNVRVLEMA